MAIRRSPTSESSASSPVASSKHHQQQQDQHHQQLLAVASKELELMRCGGGDCNGNGSNAIPAITTTTTTPTTSIQKQMQQRNNKGNSSSSSSSLSTSKAKHSLPVVLQMEFVFPSACRSIVRSLPGNSHCLDCGHPGPEWASVTYGCLLCLRCSGRHRSYGVQTSFVRSITMDTWTHAQVLAMLEGGNDQLARFFDRHQMSVVGNHRHHHDNHNHNHRRHGNHSSCATTVSSNSNSILRKRYLTKAAQFYRIHLAKHVQEVSSTGVYQGREVSRMRNNDKTHRQCGQEAKRNVPPEPLSPSGSFVEQRIQA